jgi:hypothetical protein
MFISFKLSNDQIYLIKEYNSTRFLLLRITDKFQMSMKSFIKAIAPTTIAFARLGEAFQKAKKIKGKQR